MPCEKKATVIGIIGNTQGVSIAAIPRSREIRNSPVRPLFSVLSAATAPFPLPDPLPLTFSVSSSIPAIPSVSPPPVLSVSVSLSLTSALAVSVPVTAPSFRTLILKSSSCGGEHLSSSHAI